MRRRIKLRQSNVSENDPDLFGTEIRTVPARFTLPQTAHQ